MALASHDHVIIAVQAAFRWPAGFKRGERCECCPLRGLRFLAAKSATHAAAFGRDFCIIHAQHGGHTMLNFCGVLG